ncbi:MAG: hypothetical protein BWX71_01585 [Deltaproteobacteria bacterium ADurb.Bin072]|nr:MAG: hypothetical protein BWX71_01585 [Deltaproteobacteria bacterium ADurb.Bin072]
MRSRPIPVSMLGAGSGVRVPAESRLNCMNTRFQISRYRSQSHSPALHSGLPHPTVGPWSRMISEHGPQGPVSPMAQKLSLSPSLRMRSVLTPTCLFQIS